MQDDANFKTSYRRFIDRAQAAGEVWGLQSDSGWAYCESDEYEDTEVLVFWSDRAAAQRLAVGEWSDHKAVAIQLEDFIENWLPGMDEDGALAGLDWDTELSGIEVEPGDLAADLSESGE